MRLYLYLCMMLAWVSVAAQEVPVMLSAKYDQGHPYNMSCPDRSLTGCGPTAIAEILSMYRQPAHGYGEAMYVLDFDTVRVNMEAINFDWANILDTYVSGEYTETQAKSVADLMYACGAAMRVSYDSSSTSVTNNAWMLWGLQHYLHISPESRYLHRKHYSTAEWIEMLNSQLRAGHPVFYRGTWYGDDPIGHMFVIDGLDENGNYHVNFGHSGKDDKFCNINVINQIGTYPGGKGVCYNALQAMVINCYPTPDFNGYPMQSSVSEEAIILNGDVNLEQTEVALGEAVTLSCRLRNVCDVKASITFGWALVKDGDVLEVLGQGRYGLRPGYTFTEASHRTVKLPKGLADGDYKLKLYQKSDIEEEWAAVWRDAATEVDVHVHGGFATVTIPPSHRLNPCLFLEEPIQEVETEYAATAPGRTFAMTINNNTINNFEQKVRLEITAGGSDYIYETVLPVYSQTSTPFRILVPSSAADMGNRDITSVKAFYYYDIEDRYIEMTTEEPDGLKDIETGNVSGDIYVYDISGTLLRMIKAEEVSTVYADFLSGLRHGVYVVKEGSRTRKIIR